MLVKINDKISATVTKGGEFCFVKFTSTGRRMELMMGDWNPEFEANETEIRNLANDLINEPEAIEWINK